MYGAAHPLAQWVSNNEDKQISPLDASMFHQEPTTVPASTCLVLAYIILQYLLYFCTAVVLYQDIHDYKLTVQEVLMVRTVTELSALRPEFDPRPFNAR